MHCGFSLEKQLSRSSFFLLDVEMKERVQVLFSMVNSVQTFISTPNADCPVFGPKGTENI